VTMTRASSAPPSAAATAGCGGGVRTRQLPLCRHAAISPINPRVCILIYKSNQVKLTLLQRGERWQLLRHYITTLLYSPQVCAQHLHVMLLLRRQYLLFSFICLHTYMHTFITRAIVEHKGLNLTRERSVVAEGKKAYSTYELRGNRYM